MILIKTGITIVLLFRAVYTDVKNGKIENGLIAFGLVFGLICAGMADGLPGLLSSVKMVCTITAALFFLFVMKGLGAGDIKLFAMLAAFFPEQILSIVIVSFFIGAGMALGRMAIRAVKHRPIYKRHETLNFSIPIAAGTGIVGLLQLVS